VDLAGQRQQVSVALAGLAAVEQPVRDPRLAQAVTFRDCDLRKT
jgi:hypothetical protein